MAVRLGAAAAPDPCAAPASVSPRLSSEEPGRRLAAAEGLACRSATAPASSAPDARQPHGVWVMDGRSGRGDAPCRRLRSWKRQVGGRFRRWKDPDPTTLAIAGWFP